VDKLLVNERDEWLVAALDDLHQQRAQEPLTVTVVYGAAHVRAVVTGWCGTSTGSMPATGSP